MTTAPPGQLDGAVVLFWAVSSRGLFHTIPRGSDPGSPDLVSVAGLAVCRYPNGDRHYLFKCDKDWEVVSDWDAASVDEAQAIAAQHATDERIEWHAWS